MNHITLLTYGTRGDVQPFVALGAGLQRAGWRVRLAAPEPFAPLAAPYPIDFCPLPGDPRDFSRAFSDRAKNNLAAMVRVLKQHVLPIAAGVAASVRAACQDADVVVHSFMMTIAGHTAARDLGVPDLSAQLFPIFAPTSAFPSLILPPRPVGGTLNRLSHHAFNQIFRLGTLAGYRSLLRKAPSLPPRIYWPFGSPEPSTPILFAFSPHVVPPPSDWGAHVHVTGYWFLAPSTQWQPPAALEAFLDAGPPPVCIGFGSMVSRDIPALAEIALEALAQAGQRGVLVGGWGDLGGLDLPPSVIQVGSVPHGWLFERMAAVVHHGGAGTTGAALRAGIPSIVTPIAADQPFWGRRVHELGVGPRPIPRRQLTTSRLAAAIATAVSDREMRARAKQMGDALRAEDGVARAIEIIHAVAARPSGSNSSNHRG